MPLQHAELTERIIGCAYRVHNRLGFGFLESVYENCMMIELAKQGLAVKRQCPISVYYDDVVVGEFVADIIVEDTIILELKSLRQIAPAHEIQLVNYLTATQRDLGLLLNFAERRVEVKRKVRVLPEPVDF